MTKLHFKTAGDLESPALLFLHGFMGSASVWDRFIAELKTQYFCIAVDLPGHGRSVGLPVGAYSMSSASDEVILVLDYLGIDQVSLIGYSMGGRLALFIALNYPFRVERLILESTSPGLKTHEERVQRIQNDEQLAEQLRHGDFAAFLHVWYDQPLFSSLNMCVGLRDSLVEARLKNDPQELAHSLDEMGTGRQPSLWERLDALRVSTLVITGSLDAKYHAIAKQMLTQSSMVKHRVIPSAGHNTHAEAPDAFCEALVEFVQQPHHTELS